MKSQPVLVFVIALLLFGTADCPGEDIVKKNNPKIYSYRGATRVNNVIDRNNGVVVTMVHPQSDAFQTVEFVGSSPGTVMPIPGNEFDKCLQVRVAGEELGNDDLMVFHEYKITLYDIEIDFSKITTIRPYDTESLLYQRYTGMDDAPLLNPSHPEIAQQAKELSSQSTDNLDYAKKAFIWSQNRRLQNPGAGGVSVCVPQSRGGGLSGANAIFVSLLRSGGIPARTVLGRGTDQALRLWSEFYLEGYGWIPANPSAEVEKADDPFRYFGTMSFPNRLGEHAKSIVLNHVYGDNTMPIPIEGAQPVLYSTLGYFIIWGVSNNAGYSLQVKEL